MSEGNPSKDKKENRVQVDKDDTSSTVSPLSLSASNTRQPEDEQAGSTTMNADSTFKGKEKASSKDPERSSSAPLPFDPGAEDLAPANDGGNVIEQLSVRRLDTGPDPGPSDPNTGLDVGGRQQQTSTGSPRRGSSEHREFANSPAKILASLPASSGSQPTQNTGFHRAAALCRTPGLLRTCQHRTTTLCRAATHRRC